MSSDMDQATQPAPTAPTGTTKKVAWRMAFAAVAAATTIVVAAVAVVMLTGSPGPVAADISVQEMVNRVESDRPRDPATDAVNFLPAVLGQDLRPGDGLKTYDASEARVDIVVGSSSRITRTKPNTL